MQRTYVRTPALQHGHLAHLPMFNSINLVASLRSWPFTWQENKAINGWFHQTVCQGKRPASEGIAEALRNGSWKATNRRAVLPAWPASHDVAINMYFVLYAIFTMYVVYIRVILPKVTRWWVLVHSYFNFVYFLSQNFLQKYAKKAKHPKYKSRRD